MKTRALYKLCQERRLRIKILLYLDSMLTLNALNVGSLLTLTYGAALALLMVAEKKLPSRNFLIFLALHFVYLSLLHIFIDRFRVFHMNKYPILILF